MSYRLLRASALASAVVLSGLIGAACGARNEGADAGVRTNTNANDAGAQAKTASDSAGGAEQANAGTQEIEMGDDVFRPALVTVPAGTKVTWVNKGQKAHTVVSNDKLFDSGLVNIDAEFSHTFTASGTYSYHCAPHAKMVGRIDVK
jgi:plastocyanin